MRSSSRRAVPVALAALAAATVLLLALSRYALPTGLSMPGPIPPIDGIYTAQISGFVDLPPGHALGLDAADPARLVVDGEVAAVVREADVVLADPPAQPGVRRVLVQFAPSPDEPDPILVFVEPDGNAVLAPRAALSPRRLAPASWMLRRQLETLAIAIALAWMLTGAAYGLTRARAWLIRHLPPGREQPRAVWAMLAFSLVVFAYPFWWGVPVSWSQDEVWPADLQELRDVLSPGWSSRYPPFHTYVVAAVNAPLIAAGGLDLLEPRSERVFSILKGVTHLVSVAMAVGIAAMLYAGGSRAAGHRVGILAGLFWTLALPAVFYAKTANLDIPYTFWFAVALLLYLRAVEAGDVRAHVGFAAAASLAIATKDQAYGAVILPALHLAALRWRALGGGLAGAAGLMRDRAIVLATVAGVLVFAAAHNLPLNWSGFAAHVATITGEASEGYRMIDRTSPAGHLWLGWRTVQQIAWSLTWPGALLAFLGVVLAIRRDRRRYLPWLIPAISYFLLFILPVGYTYDRFMLPLCVVLALFAAMGLDRLWPAGSPRWRTVAAAALLTLMAMRAASINLLMAADSRYEVERWLREHVPPQTRIAVVENPELLPRLGRFSPTLIQYPLDQFEGFGAPVAVISEHYRRRFVPEREEVQWHDDLVAGRRGYRVVLRYRQPVPLAILSWERQFRDPDPSFSALHKVNPEITVLFRDGWPSSFILQPSSFQ
jgi:hypothetical protein